MSYARPIYFNELYGPTGLTCIQDPQGVGGTASNTRATEQAENFGTIIV